MTDVIEPAVAAGVYSTPRWVLWTGYVLSTLLTLFMAFDGVMKLVQPEAVMKASAQLGYPASCTAGIGIALLICTVLYAVPQTAVLGAISLTGYLGGAVASQVRIGASWISLFFPFLFAVLIWVSLLLRDRRLRAVLPLRS
jgi:hypothetical protein